MAKYTDLAKDIVKNVGGKENVKSLHHCVTRLRFVLKDEKKANTDVLKKMDGVATVVKAGEQYQVVIGNHVADVYNEITPILGLVENNEETFEKRKISNPKELLDVLIDALSKIFQPILGVLAAAGMLKGVAALLVACGLSRNSGFYLLLQGAGEGLFSLLPVFIAYTSAKYFKMSQTIAMTIAAALIYPNLAKGMIDNLRAANFFGLPIVIPGNGYTSTVMPIIFSVWLGSHIERFLKKVIPAVVKTFLVPFFTVFIVYVLTILIIGPIMTTVSDMLGNGLNGLYGINPIIAGALIAGLWMIMVMFGVHWGIVSIYYATIATTPDHLIAVTFPHSFALAGIIFAIMLKTRGQKVKELGLPAAISGIFGVTEPGIYGILVPMKIPFVLACVISAITGAIAGAMDITLYMTGGLGIFKLPSFLNPATPGILGKSFWAAVVSAVLALVLGFVVQLFMKVPTIYEEEVNDKELKSESNVVLQDEILESGLQGNVVALSDVKDEAFASGALGNGVAIEPTVGKVVAMADGKIATLFPTYHAIALLTNNGAEVLVHVGLDTVQLNGKYFTPRVAEGDEVKKGDLLLEFDIEGLKNDGYVVTTPIIITNSDEYKEIIVENKEKINFGERLLTLVK